uniref:tRNA (guanine(26)-N(2))-dimethyltransferase n=1 Tax=Geotrypetes seraphini TaxID=260995 RepID=A0A6P8SAV6_GEOSA|nr:TRMT1-like protein isoform X2 [Geotrypetes seraphini]
MQSGTCQHSCIQQMSTVKVEAHYHCIVCATTIQRRSDMVSHIKQHVASGETSGGFAAEQMEADTNVWVLPNYSTPQKSDTYFNPRMKISRQLIFCTLATFMKERNLIACLDAFGGTGIMGLQWAKHFGRVVKVTINDLNENSVAMIQENCSLNKIKVMKQKEEQEAADVIEKGEEFINMVEVTNLDANVLMHLRAFDFIHLDPYGTAVNYLDAAFRNIRNLGILSVTSTDTSALYAKNVSMTQRHYGCNIVRTEYFREAGVRIVVAALARAAARSNKGIEVLLSVALDHFVLVVVRILRGPSQADECVTKIRHLFHCLWCEERIFQKEGNLLEANPYKQLPCTCNKNMTVKTAVELGPMWSGSIFHSGFLKRMLHESVRYGIKEIQGFLKTLICEADCTIQKSFCHEALQDPGECEVIIRRPEVSTEYSSQLGKRRYPFVVRESQGKVLVEHPAFYYSIHRHSMRGMNIPKLNKFLKHLTDDGFQVSRTHFDPTGVRTDANLEQIKSTLMEYSNRLNCELIEGQSGDGPPSTENATSESQQPSEEPQAKQDAAFLNCPQKFEV